MSGPLSLSVDNAYFSRNKNQKNKPMKTAEILLHYMDELQKIVNIINSWLEKGVDFFQKVKVWIETVIDYIERGIDALVQSMGGRKTDFSLMAEEYLFV